MIRKYSFPLLFVFLIVVFIPACGLSLPTCDPGDLGAPVLENPDWREVVDGSAVILDWSYPDTTCEPEQYEIILSRDRDFATIDITDQTSGPDLNWSPTTSLDPAEEYFWRVAAMVGSTKSSYSSELRSFFTEPLCDLGDLVMPTLTLPVAGGIFERGYSSLEWEWPISSCIPSGYRVELSPTEDLSNTTLFGGTGTPGTRWAAGSKGDPAAQYWWRIAAVTEEGDIGPFSTTRTFFTDPVCSGSSLVAPILDEPADSTVSSSLNPEFRWSYPDPSCSPEGTQMLISSTADMSSIEMNFDHPGYSSRSFQAGVPLEDCREYFWQVGMISEGMDGPWSGIQSFTIDAAGACACDPGSIPTPNLLSPSSFEIVSVLLPVLAWANPGPCIPEGYAVHLSAMHDFSDTALFGGSSGTSWTPGTALDPATHYRWKIAGMVGTDMGDFGDIGHFFTGPECTSIGDLVIPDRLAPADGAVLDTVSPILRYHPGDPGCIPDGYRIDLQTDPGFGGTNLVGDLSFPGTTVIVDPLPDCDLYYWKVSGIQDGLYGPESDVGWFYINESGTCPLPSIPGTMKGNTFCREGTYPEFFPAIYTFLEDQIVDVVARNPFATYLQVQIPPADPSQPPDPQKRCWLYFEAVELWGDPLTLREELPPPKPEIEVEDDTPDEESKCTKDLGVEACTKMGGKYDVNMNRCICP